jgi:hypothetical protein
MNKKINLVYEWIGPKGPISNNRIPTIIDLIDRQIDVSSPEIRYDFHLVPHFHNRFKNVNIVPASNLPDDVFLYELNFGNYHYRDLLHAFNFNDGILDQNSTSPLVIERIKNKTAYILITLLFEGYLSDKFLSAMQEYFKHKNIPLTQIVYVTNCGNGKDVYENYCQRHNIVSEMHMEYLPVFRVDKTDIENALAKYSLEGYTPGPKEKTFLCFNRRYSDHRLLFFMMTVKRNLVDKFYMSMAASQPESDRTFKTNAEYLIYKHNTYGLTTEDIDSCNSLLPLVLDNDNFNRYPMETAVDPVEKFYKNSLINIINETYFFNNIIHITEKTYKPIAFLQPFILLGAAGSLQHIKDMGFKTFGEFWDESYDTEIDDSIRFTKIVNIVEEISNWAEQKKIDFSYKIKGILEYNLNRLNTMNNLEIDKFVEKYGA